MVRLIRWFLGYVTFSFSGGFTQGFINECFEKGYNIRQIQTDGKSVTARCPAGLYRYLRPIARQHGGRISIIRKHGPVFHLLPLRNRWGLFIGLLFTVALIGFLNGFIWNIEITGTEKLDNETVMSFLQENGFYEGVYFRSLDIDKLENLMLASFDECAWVHINRNGTSAKVEINETVLKPDVADTSGIANLKATKDGIIIKSTVYDGWAAVKTGDSVTKGDLLISGIYESEKGEVNLYAHARGEYIAQVSEPVSLTVSRTQSYPSYRPTAVYRYLHFFGLKLPLYIGIVNKENCEVSHTYDYLTLNANKLPIGIETMSVTPYTMEEKQLSDSELEELANSEKKRYLTENYANCEIIKDNTEIALDSDSATIRGTLLCLENIGEEVMVKEDEVSE